jgi:ATP-binding cassette, subfamily B, bacterial PglK
VDSSNHFLKIFKTLTKNHKYKILLLLPLFLIRIIVEAISIGLIFPFVKVISEPEKIISIIVEDQTYNKIMNLLIDFDSKVLDDQINILIYVSAILLILVFFIKNIYLFFLNYFEINFYNSLSDYYPKKLFTKYINMPYEKFINMNTAYMIRNMNQSQSFIDSIQSINQIIIEIIILSLVLVGLFYVNFSVTFVTLLIFLLFIGSFYFFTKNRISSWGLSRHFNDGEKLKSQHHGFGLIKDVKIFKIENYFPKKFSEHNIKSLISTKNISLVEISTRYLLEIVLVLVFSILIISQHSMKQSFIETLPLIALYAAAGYRLMPSVNRILTSLQRIKFNLPIVDRLYPELMALKNNEFKNKILKEKNVIYKPNIILNDVNFSYFSVNKKTLKNVSLEVKFGSIIGIIGDSGSGKSTLVNLITGLLEPSSGEIYFEDSKSKIRLNENNFTKIGYVPQNVYLIDSSLKNNISLAKKDDEVDLIKLDNSIAESNLEKTIKNLEYGINTIVGEKGTKISGGQLQRVGLARALYNNPEILILDEATSGLDFDSENEILENLKKLKGSRTIIIISHRKNSLKYCDKVFKIEDANVLEYKSQL